MYGICLACEKVMWVDFSWHIAIARYWHIKVRTNCKSKFSLCYFVYVYPKHPDNDGRHRSIAISTETSGKMQVYMTLFKWKVSPNMLSDNSNIASKNTTYINSQRSMKRYWDRLQTWKMVSFKYNGPSIQHHVYIFMQYVHS